jgi:hypothetical protein
MPSGEREARSELPAAQAQSRRPSGGTHVQVRMTLPYKTSRRRGLPASAARPSSVFRNSSAIPPAYHDTP